MIRRVGTLRRNNRFCGINYFIGRLDEQKIAKNIVKNLRPHVPVFNGKYLALKILLL
jgi:hypothetical protein